MAFLKAAQIKAFLDALGANYEPEKWFKAVNTILVDQAEHLDSIEARLAKLAPATLAIARDVDALKKAGPVAVVGETATEGAAAPEAPTELQIPQTPNVQASRPMDTPPPPSPKPQNGGQRRPQPPMSTRVGANGEPLSPEQAAIESAMDDATGG